MYLVAFLGGFFVGLFLRKFKIGYISTFLCHVPVSFLQVCARQVELKKTKSWLNLWTLCCDQLCEAQLKAGH